MSFFNVPQNGTATTWPSKAMTTRGCSTADFQKIADFLDRCCKIALKAPQSCHKNVC